MWCKTCNIETDATVCEQCGNKTEEDIPYEIYWCDECKTPIIKAVNSIDKNTCPICGKTIAYMCADLRPVFPEERLLFEIISGKPLSYIDKSVWASNNRYYIDGKAIAINSAWYRKLPPDTIRLQLEKYKSQNNYSAFNAFVEKFIVANQGRLDYLSMSFLNCPQILTSIDDVKEAFRWSKAFLWLNNHLSSCPDYTSFFGEIAASLHNSLINNPKPYRKEVKDLLANTLAWIDYLKMDEIRIDIPNYSQRVRKVL